jgi:PAS domain S-box-containing protein
MNPSAEELTGFSTAEARGRLLNEVFHIVNSETLDPARDPVEHSIRSGAAVALENHTMLISRDGRRYQLADSAAPIRDRDRNMTGVVMVFRDFTEQYERSRELREARRFLEEVFDAIQDGISVVDKDMTITRVNAWMSERFGGRTPLTGKRCFEAYQRRMTTCPMCPVAETLSTGEVHEATKELTAEDGTVWWAHLFAYPMTDENGNVTGAIEHVRDITEQKHAQQRLEKALAEKDYLLKELNHRVKNNLNMVSSLVSLKDSALGEQVDLSDIRRRIDAIQIIHQKLHEDTDVSSIDLRDYVDELLDTLFSSFTAQAVEVSNRVASMSMAPPAAVPLGMIVTELAANAIEHGFDDTGPARFSVSMSGEDEHHVLTVSNTGAPFPEDIDLENPQTLGLQLVSALVSQLDGTIEVRRRPSPVFSIRIPSASLEARRANG